MRAKLKSSQKRATQRTQNTVHSEGFEVRAQCENAKQAIAAPQTAAVVCQEEKKSPSAEPKITHRVSERWYQSHREAE